MLTSLGVKATFKVVGEKARVLEQRGRTDVIEALGKHDIGYHSNLHSQQPTPAVYLQHAGWDDGIEEFLRREAQGAKDVERIFGVAPICYGQPGSSWAPQAYPALRRDGHPDVPRRGRPGRPRRPAVLLRRDAERLPDALERHAHGARGRRQPREGQGARSSTTADGSCASGRRDDQHLLPPERVGAHRVLGRGELQQGRQPAARGVEEARAPAARRDRPRVRGLRAVHRASSRRSPA